MDAPSILNEDDRLLALHKYAVLDTSSEPAFDSLTRAAATVCEASMAAVSLIDRDRQWFKARVGLELAETSRDISFCAHAMHDDVLLVVPDTQGDLRFRDNPLVLGKPGVRFYAGASIRADSGEPLGALCVFDTVPRPEGLTSIQAQMLRVLADQVEPQLRLRRAAEDQQALARRQEQTALATLNRESRLISALESAAVGWWDWDVAADRVAGNAELAHDFGLDKAATAAGLPPDAFFANVHPLDRAWLQAAIAEALETGDPFREEYRLVQPGGGVRWTSARGRCLQSPQGSPTRFPGVAIDITHRKHTEERLREADAGREMALDTARLGRFDHDLIAGARFYDARALEMFGLTIEEVQDPDLVASRVHPEDRERVVEAQAAATNPERRGPYREVYRIHNVVTGQERWISAVGRSRFSDGVCTRIMGVLEDVTEAKLAEAHRLLLIHELNHRVKNTLALVQSLVDASLRSAGDVANARVDIAGRIQALGRAHELLTAQNWSAASVSHVVQEVVASLSLAPARLKISGEPVQLGPKPALQLTLALHELATNAVKYGALSNASGSVSLDWRVERGEGREVFCFDWIEQGGPPVAAPTRRGFGSRLIERVTASEFGGEVELTYPPEGACWRLKAPYAGLAERGRSDMQVPAG